MYLDRGKEAILLKARSGLQRHGRIAVIFRITCRIARAIPRKGKRIQPGGRTVVGPVTAVGQIETEIDDVLSAEVGTPE